MLRYVSVIAMTEISMTVSGILFFSVFAVSVMVLYTRGMVLRNTWTKTPGKFRCALVLDKKGELEMGGFLNGPFLCCWCVWILVFPCWKCAGAGEINNSNGLALLSMGLLLRED